MAKTRAPATNATLSIEELRERRQVRANTQEPPSVEMLRAGLRSRAIAAKIDAAMWIAKFQYNPRVSGLHEPLLEDAMKILGRVTSCRLGPRVSNEVYAELCIELMEYTYEKTELGPMSADEKASRVAEVQKLLDGLATGEITEEQLLRRFKPRSPRSVN